MRRALLVAAGAAMAALIVWACVGYVVGMRRCATRYQAARTWADSAAVDTTESRGVGSAPCRRFRQ